MADERKPTVDDGIQHGIDDDPTNDAAKGAITGGIGAGAMGAIAGSMLGPAGAVAGALIGGAVGAAASGAAVAAIDRHDNDNNITGLGDTVAYDHDTDDEDVMDDETLDTDVNTATYGLPGGPAIAGSGGGLYPEASPASSIGASPMGTVNDPVTARDTLYDNRDRVTTDYTPGTTLSSTSLTDDAVDENFDDINRTRDLSVGNSIPGVQTGGHAVDGTPDTRGITEKVSDAVTGDRIDDKTGKIVR